jgi:hypothetical protein
MLLNAIEKNPHRALQYLERYVNDGSPSGFTEMNRSSSSTDPLGLTPWYHLFCITPESGKIETFGEVPSLVPLESQIGGNWFLLHPDMSNHPDLNNLEVTRLDRLRVIPTASVRTVQILSDESRDYIKLHYDGIIGRIDRKLSRLKAISGPEISRHVLNAIEDESLPRELCLLHETGAKILHANGNSSSEWGMVWRDGRPRGPRSDKIKYLSPLFALWSVDRLHPYHPSILESLCERWGGSSATVVLERLLFPILSSYFQLLLKLGLQMEFNAQNLLIGFDENWTPVAVVLRDMMGTEKDLTLREHLGLSNDFESAPYKAIDRTTNADMYQIRHSFVFDFKVGTYVLDPIIDSAVSIRCLEERDTVSVLRAYAAKFISQLPSDFFPSEDRWYRHDNVLLNAERNYVPVSNPRYR